MDALVRLRSTVGGSVTLLILSQHHNEDSAVSHGMRRGQREFLSRVPWWRSAVLARCCSLFPLRPQTDHVLSRVESCI